MKRLQVHFDPTRGRSVACHGNRHRIAGVSCPFFEESRAHNGQPSSVLPARRAMRLGDCDTFRRRRYLSAHARIGDETLPRSYLFLQLLAATGVCDMLIVGLASL